MNTMIYRRATAADASGIARLHADSWRRTYRGIFLDAYLDGDVLTERLATWTERLSLPRDDQYVTVCAEQERIRGFICAYARGDAGWGTFIDNLHVAESHAGSGIGTILLSNAASWARARRPSDGVYLWVLEGNVAARHFYERRGAVHRESVVRENPGGGVATNLRYVWTDPEHMATACSSPAPPSRG
jgi:ribosomal protein S18 acetylase RimI-like enzyme